MSKTKYLAAKTLDHVIKGVEYTSPSDLYLALFNEPPTEDDTNAFTVGDGSSSDPYEIWNVNQLQLIGTSSHFRSSHYKLMVNLDLEDVPFPKIGTLAAPFQGVFDGQGRVISNLKIETPLDTNVGLFSRLNGSGCEVKNLYLTNVDIEGGGLVGGLSGRIDSGAILTNVYVTGLVVSNGDTVGGICSRISGSTVSNCGFEGVVTGARYVGGFIGTAEGSAVLIEKCYSKGSVTSSSQDAGGLLGLINSVVTVQSCFSTSNVFSGGSAGGLVGFSSTSFNIEDCYATGNVQGSGPYQGGFIGRITSSSATITRSYATGNSSVGQFIGQTNWPSNLTDIFYNSDSICTSCNGIGTGLTTAQFEDEANFSNFTFYPDEPHIWRMDTESGRPRLAWEWDLTDIPSDVTYGAYEVDALDYARIPLRASLGALTDGFISNTSLIEFEPVEPNWGVVKAFGVYDSSEGGNLLTYKRIKPTAEDFTRLFWDIGRLTFTYTKRSDTILDWDDRPKSGVPDGYEIQYEPTGALYKYSSNVKDYVRAEYYDIFQYDLQAELSGNYLPLDEPDYPWDEAQGVSPYTNIWSVFNDGSDNWVRMNTTTVNQSEISIVTKILPNESHSYFVQGWVYVPSAVGSFDRRSEINALGYSPDTPVNRRIAYTLTGATSPHQNRIAHLKWSAPTTATAGGNYFYLSPQTNSAPVWLEIYGIRGLEDTSKFKSLIYVNHNVEPMNYYDESMTNLSATSEPKVVEVGDNTTFGSSDTRYRDFKFCNLWRRY